MTGRSYRGAAWAAIASGFIGILAFGCMTGAVFVRSADSPSELLFRLNDAGVMLLKTLVAMGRYREACGFAMGVRELSDSPEVDNLVAIARNRLESSRTAANAAAVKSSDGRGARLQAR